MEKLTPETADLRDVSAPCSTDVTKNEGSSEIQSRTSKVDVIKRLVIKCIVK